MELRSQATDPTQFKGQFKGAVFWLADNSVGVVRLLLGLLIGHRKLLLNMNTVPYIRNRQLFIGNEQQMVCYKIDADYSKRHIDFRSYYGYWD